MRKRRLIRLILYILSGFLLILAGLYIYYIIATRVKEPEIAGSEQFSMVRETAGADAYTCSHGWLRKAADGWWVMYLEGNPYEIGYAHGLLTQELNYSQEKAFLERLAEMIPSKFYQRFMLAFVRFFNRNLDQYVKEEYRQEICGISRFASPEFGFMGPAYARMLNYHAAHDLGHAVQNMNLVACTAFGAWDGHSADSSLILGRNFDFFVNDDFARDKILCFIAPDSGYNFVMVTWAGFAGVVSGMNEQGLTITLNAAKSSIPGGAKTPVSLLAREILQYAGNIEEAQKIAMNRQTFVSESFFIGSASDHKAVVLEKTPDKTAIFDPDTNFLIVTNHFQSEEFLKDQLNRENIENETSAYRYKRMEELLHEYPLIGPGEAASILRDYRGLGGKDIGLGNEKAVNQFIAHHSVIFQPEKKRVWISLPPYQLGEYRAFDADSVWNAAAISHGSDTEVHRDRTESHRGEDEVDFIPADRLLLDTVYPDLMKFRQLAAKIEAGNFAEGDAEALILLNPEYFETYRILGDYFKTKGLAQRAEDYYRLALLKEAPSMNLRKKLQSDLNPH